MCGSGHDNAHLVLPGAPHVREEDVEATRDGSHRVGGREVGRLALRDNGVAHLDLHVVLVVAQPARHALERLGADTLRLGGELHEEEHAGGHEREEDAAEGDGGEHVDIDHVPVPLRTAHPLLDVRVAGEALELESDRADLQPTRYGDVSGSRGTDSTGI